MEHCYTSVRLPKPLHEKWRTIANELGISRNAVISVLLEGAEVKSRPEVNVSLNANSRNAQAFQGRGATAVSA